MALYRDRTHAGERLAAAMAGLGGEGVVVVALPRGGVPVAAVVARELGAPLDVLPVRKVGHPHQPELALGALALGGRVVRNEEVLARSRAAEGWFERQAALERRELERRAVTYRGSAAPPDLTGKEVLLVDDGLATGATMRAAVAAARDLGARRVVVAVPVGAPSTVAQLRAEADAVVCVFEPQTLSSVGEWYDDFAQTTDAEVLAILAERAP
ncbi:MAG: phosphoribosyltransferase [Trueperaceae bacterium]|nr:phosphoribosyltransferase [Trueperaceae bacterium]